MIFHSRCKKEMWGEAIRTAAYLTNRCPTKGMDMSPAEKWLNRKPDLSKVHNFGQNVNSKIVKPLKKTE
jgi:hypothetical protein